MVKLPLGSLFKIFLENKSSKRFLVGTLVSFSFSIAVILCTMGLMDGFEFSLKQALAYANGDIKFVGREGFFQLDEKKFDSEEFENLTTVLHVESFAIVNEESKGILLQGVETKSFQSVTGIDTSKLTNGVMIGSEFQKKYDLKIGDSIVLALASQRSKDQGSAILEEFVVQDIITHGIYKKDFRLFYINKSVLEDLLHYKHGTANLGLIKLKEFDNLKNSLSVLRSRHGDDYRFTPYWSEYDYLIEAVEVEKQSISLILQLIVIVAILNVVAFIIYISEIKSQDIFMLRALGLSFKSFQKFWYWMLLFIWVASCFLALGMVEIFENVILKLPFLKIPGDIYVLSDLTVNLGTLDYLYVMAISMIWIFLIGFITINRMRKKSLIAGLRQEFR